MLRYIGVTRATRPEGRSEFRRRLTLTCANIRLGVRVGIGKACLLARRQSVLRRHEVNVGLVGNVRRNEDKPHARFLLRGRKDLHNVCIAKSVMLPYQEMHRGVTGAVARFETWAVRLPILSAGRHRQSLGVVAAVRERVWLPRSEETLCARRFRQHAARIGGAVRQPAGWPLRAPVPAPAPAAAPAAGQSANGLQLLRVRQLHSEPLPLLLGTLALR